MQRCTSASGLLNRHKLCSVHFLISDSSRKTCRYRSSITFKSLPPAFNGRTILSCSDSRCGTIPSLFHRPLGRFSVLSKRHGVEKMKTKYKSLNFQVVRHASGKDDTKGPKWILYMSAISFGIGFVLLFALIYKMVKIRVRGFKGFEDTSLPYLRKPRIIRYKRYLLPTLFEPVLRELNDINVREDDIYAVSFPRSGLVLLQEIVYLVQTGDFNKAKDINVDERCPYLEFSSLEELEEASSPRFIRSHLGLELLPKELQEGKGKVIYIARNCKDVVVSYYETAKIFSQVVNFSGSLSEFCEHFSKHRVPFGPWPHHVLNFWEKRDASNFLFLMYEDLVKNPEGSIREIAKFLGKTLTDEQVKKIKEHCSFKNMKNNPAINFNRFKSFGVGDETAKLFIRKGEVGEWAGSLEEGDVKKLNFMIALYLKDTGLMFDYGLGKPTAGDFYGK